MTTDTGITLQQYWDRLNRHDWYYQYSDDRHVNQQGRESEANLFRLSQQSEEHRKLLAAWQDHKFRDAAKPERPT